MKDEDADDSDVITPFPSVPSSVICPTSEPKAQPALLVSSDRYGGMVGQSSESQSGMGLESVPSKEGLKVSSRFSTVKLSAISYSLKLCAIKLVVYSSGKEGFRTIDRAAGNYSSPMSLKAETMHSEQSEAKAGRTAKSTNNAFLTTNERRL
jgi:hypothetical protein